MSANAQTVDPYSIVPNDDLMSGAVAADGKLLLGGEFTVISSANRSRLVRLNTDATVDSALTIGANSGYVRSILVHPDGSLLVGGNFTQFGGAAHVDLAHIQANDAIDASFTLGTADGAVSAMALQPDGKVVVGGTFQNIGGEAHARIARVNADGTIESAFTASVSDGEVFAILVQSSGKIVIAGSFTQVGGSTRNGIARLNADGTLDTAFDPNIGGGIVTGMAQQADGKILVYGNFSTVSGVGQNRYVRLNDDGTRDTTFVLATNTSISSMVVQADGKILVAGGFAGTPLTGQAVIRVDASGAVDATFTPVAIDNSAHLILDNTGKIYVAGAIATVGGEARQSLARISNPTAPTSELEFDTDVTWTLGGSAPVPTFVRFQTSADASTWTDLGSATFSSGAWRLTAPTLPNGTAHLRAVGVVPNNGSDSSLISATIDVDIAVASRLLNISTRAQCGTGDNVMIPGFVVGGSGTKKLLIRAVGPTLGGTPFNIPGVLPNPRMTLKRLDTSVDPNVFVDVAANDEWETNTNAADITATADALFAFDFQDAHEAALLVDLTPGQYTVVADDAGGASGVAIVEAYDADTSASTATLLNISNRGMVGEGAQVMIPGFVISSEGPKTVLIRAVGPRLATAPFNVTGTLPDPKIELYRRDGATDTLIATQDNWSDDPDAATTVTVSQQVGAFGLPADSKDAAFVITLQPGSYTAVTSSAVAGETGVALVEVYVVP